MCKKMRIVIEDLEHYRAKFALWSVLFVQIDDACFPDEQWWDATSSVLCIWLNNIVSFLGGINESALLPFMDGDYSVMLIRKSRDKTTMRWITTEKSTTLECEVDLKYFCRQLLSAVEKVKKEYGTHLDAPQICELLHCAVKLRDALKKATVQN